MVIKDKDLKIPLIQGGMGVGVSLGNLAGHVAKCGAMGVISTADTGFMEPDFWKNPIQANVRGLEKEIKKAKEIAGGNGLVAINAMVATTYYEQSIKAAVEAGIDCVISGAGLPLELPTFVKGSNTAIAPIVSSAKAANVICRMWDKRYQVAPDFVVIEGSEAGGHLGFSKEELLNHTAKPLLSILQEVLDVIKPFEEKYGRSIPVFVAGGIYTRDDVNTFMNAGAAGVQVATRFIATFECDASMAYKEAFIEAGKEDIQIVQSPVGMPGRALRTPLMERLEKENRIAPKKCAACLHACDVKTTPYCITNALIEAVKGNYEEGLFFCGSNAWKIDKIISVQELIQELMG